MFIFNVEFIFWKHCLLGFLFLASIASDSIQNALTVWMFRDYKWRAQWQCGDTYYTHVLLRCAKYVCMLQMKVKWQRYNIMPCMYNTLHCLIHIGYAAIAYICVRIANNIRVQKYSRWDWTYRGAMRNDRSQSQKFYRIVYSFGS